MCVLSFVPLPNNQYIITNNRDEHNLRSKAIPPTAYMHLAEASYYPKDPKAGGTWIASNDNYSLILLNGAYVKHISKPPYSKSRGQVILDFLEHLWHESSDFNQYFKAFENFTLFIIDNTKQTITQLVWDGETTDKYTLEWDQAFMWSSGTLYTQEIITLRKKTFKQFLKKYPEPSALQLKDFHRYTNLGDPENNFTMKRPDGIFTQCITQITYKQGVATMSFTDLL
jgi:uncharacterized protein with NRDE domain